MKKLLLSIFLCVFALVSLGQYAITNEGNNIKVESSTDAPLICGDFENNLLTINGDMTVTGKVAASDSICIARFRWASKGTIPNDTLVLIRGVNDTIEWHPPRAP